MMVIDNPRPIRHNLTGIQSFAIPFDEALPVSTQVAVSTGQGRPDLTGLAAAQAAQEAARPAVVILFGSRARGDWREHSDIDLLVIAEGQDNARRAAAAAQAGIDEWELQNRSGLHVDIIPLTRQQFERCRRAKQHIAGQADTYGVVMSGTPLPPQSGYADEYPDHWPATLNRFKNAEVWLRNYNEMVDGDHWHQAMMGMAAQQAVENALKGVLSCLNAATGYSHQLLDTWQKLQGLAQFQETAPPELLAAGETLFAYLKYPDRQRPGEYKDWLTEYAAHYRYSEPSVIMSPAQRRELQSLVNSFVELLLAHIRRVSGITVRDVYPEGLRPWERHQPQPGIPDPEKE